MLTSLTRARQFLDTYQWVGLLAVVLGVIAIRQMILYLSLQPLSDFLTTSFDTLGMLLAFALCGVFTYALTVYLNPQH